MIVLITYVRTSVWRLYRLLCDKSLKYVRLNKKVHTNENHVVAALLKEDSRLAYSTGNIQRICKYAIHMDQSYSKLGMDSHADISCAGRDAHILAQSEGGTCTVHPFNDSYDPMTGIKIVNVLYKYESVGGEECTLEINQCLDFTKTMVHSILCTDQAKNLGILVNDVPKVCDSTSTQDIHTKDGTTIMPLEMNGPIPYLPVSKPTSYYIEYLPRIKLTSDDIEWDPHTIFNGWMVRLLIRYTGNIYSLK